MTAPLGSKTVPEMLPPVAARSGRAAIRSNTMANPDRCALTLVTGKIDFLATIFTSRPGRRPHELAPNGAIVRRPDGFPTERIPTAARDLNYLEHLCAFRFRFNRTRQLGHLDCGTLDLISIFRRACNPRPRLQRNPRNEWPVAEPPAACFRLVPVVPFPTSEVN
jgi:hypothetical protein